MWNTNINSYIVFAFVAIPILIALIILFQKWSDMQNQSHWQYMSKDSEFNTTAYSYFYLNKEDILINDTLHLNANELRNTHKELIGLQFLNFPVQVHKFAQSDTIFIERRTADPIFLIFQ